MKPEFDEDNAKNVLFGADDDMIKLSPDIIEVGDINVSIIELVAPIIWLDIGIISIIDLVVIEGTEQLDESTK